MSAEMAFVREPSNVTMAIPVRETAVRMSALQKLLAAMVSGRDLNSAMMAI